MMSGFIFLSSDAHGIRAVGEDEVKRGSNEKKGRPTALLRYSFHLKGFSLDIQK